MSKWYWNIKGNGIFKKKYICNKQEKEVKRNILIKLRSEEYVNLH